MEGERGGGGLGHARGADGRDLPFVLRALAAREIRAESARDGVLELDPPRARGRAARGAGRAGHRGPGLCPMASLATAHPLRVRQRIRVGRHYLAATEEQGGGEADGGMHGLVLCPLGAGRELRDREVEVAIDGEECALLDGEAVVQLSHARRHAVHRQDASLGEALRQPIPDELLVCHAGLDAVAEIAPRERCEIGRGDAVHAGQQPPRDLGDLGRAAQPVQDRVSAGGPVGGCAELPVAVGRRRPIPPPDTSREERAAQAFLRHRARRDVELLHRQEGDGRLVARDPRGMLVVVLVVVAPPAQRERDRERLPAPPRAAGALLVVETHRRHVGHRHGAESADVDPDLHRRRHAQDIDLVRPRHGHLSVQVDDDVAELPLPRRLIVRLCHQLLDMHAQRLAVCDGLVSIVVPLLQLGAGPRRVGGQGGEAIGAYPSRPMQVRSRA